MSTALSSEAQAKAAQMPDIDARLERFINAQFAQEHWRAKHGRPEVAVLVQEAVAEATALKGSGVDRDTLFARLLLVATTAAFCVIADRSPTPGVTQEYQLVRHNFRGGRPL